MSKTKDFSERIRTFNQQIAHWKQRVESPPQKVNLFDVHTAYEELNVAQEELRQQNEELTAAHLLLEHERERYRDLFEMAPDGYFVTDTRGVIHEANRAASKLLGTQPEFLKSKSFFRFIHADDARTARDRIADLLHTRGTIGWTARIAPRAIASFYAAIAVTAVNSPILGPREIVGIRWLVRNDHDRAQLEIRARALAEENALLRAQLAELIEQQPRNSTTGQR